MDGADVIDRHDPCPETAVFRLFESFRHVHFIEYPLQNFLAFPRVLHLHFRILFLPDHVCLHIGPLLFLWLSLDRLNLLFFFRLVHVSFHSLYLVDSFETVLEE